MCVRLEAVYAEMEEKRRKTGMNGHNMIPFKRILAKNAEISSALILNTLSCHKLRPNFCILSQCGIKMDCL